VNDDWEVVLVGWVEVTDKVEVKVKVEIEIKIKTST